MEFINNGETKKIRIEEESGYGWKTVRHGEIVDLPKKLGQLHKFDEYVEKVEPVKKAKAIKVVKAKKKKVKK